jgi:molybdopterin adenylyltransferase
LQDWLTRALKNPVRFESRLIPDEQARISATLIELVDAGLRTGLDHRGHRPGLARRHPRSHDGRQPTRKCRASAKQMRQISLRFVPTAILSRQCAVIRDKSLIINLPGQPKSIQETLEGLKDASGASIVNGIFAAVPYCVDLIGGPYLETRDEVCKAFRPKSATRPTT